jgi:hypothetical protein
MPYKDREKQRAFQRAWIQRRRKEWLADNGPCEKCGSKKDLIVASPDRTKPIPHRVWTHSAKRRDRVLSGCIVLCRDCFLRHLHPPPAHGTVARYSSRRYPCRCELCRAARARSEGARRRRKANRENSVEAWKTEQQKKLRQKYRTLTIEKIREISKRWSSEIKNLEIPKTCFERGRPLVEAMFLLIASTGRLGVTASEIVNESALAPSDAEYLIDALMRNGLVIRARSRLIAQRVRGAKKKMRRATIEFQALRREETAHADVIPDPPREEPDEEPDKTQPIGLSDCIERVMYRLFGLDE